MKIMAVSRVGTCRGGILSLAREIGGCFRRGAAPRRQLLSFLPGSPFPYAPASGEPGDNVDLSELLNTSAFNLA